MKYATLLLAVLCATAHADAPPIDCAAPKAKPHRPVRRGVIPRLPMLCLAPPSPPLIVMAPPSEYEQPAFLKGRPWPVVPGEQERWVIDERLGRHPKPVVVHSVPEPGTLVLVLAGLFAVQRIRADREGQS